MPRTTLGQRIRAARQFLNVGTFELAHHLALSSNDLDKMENDKLTPDDDLLTRIATITSVSREWLVTGEGDMLLGPERTSDDSIIGRLDRCVQKQAQTGTRQRQHQAIRVAEACSTLTKALLNQTRSERYKPVKPGENLDLVDTGCEAILQIFTLMRQNGLYGTDVIERIESMHNDQS